MQYYEFLKKERRTIFSIILGLTLFGILIVYESSSLYAYKNHLDQAYFLKRQIIFFLVGLGLFSATLLVDLEALRRNSKKILFFTIAALAVLIILGKTAGGAKRWFHLPGFNIQPSELLKISFLVFCADYLSSKRDSIENFKQGVLPLLLVLGSVFFLLLIQPDFGNAVFWAFWLFAMLFIFRAKISHLLSMILVSSSMFIILIKTHPYRFRRILGFLDPFADPQGMGFQLIQSQIAYARGGLFGVGLGEGLQKLFFLPAAHTDFILSIIAEEFGLIGVLSFLSIFFICLYKMIHIARQVNDDFRAGILWGIILIFFFEITINAGVSCGFLPTKGLSLPFISYGGSSLVIHYILLGLFFNASRPIVKEHHGGSHERKRVGFPRGGKAR